MVTCGVKFDFKIEMNKIILRKKTLPPHISKCITELRVKIKKRTELTTILTEKMLL